MRLVLLPVLAGIGLAACAPTGASSRAPGSPNAVGPASPGFRDAQPDLDPFDARRSPVPRAPANRPETPVFTR